MKRTTSQRHHQNTLRLLIGLTVVTLTGMICLLSVGPANISIPQILAILFHEFHPLSVFSTKVDYPLWMRDVVIHVRLPRLLVGASVGAALALCGALMQSLFRNPLASPSVLGVSSGASLGAVIALYLGFALVNVWLLPLFAFLGAGITLLLVYFIAIRDGSTQLATLLLAGIAISSLNGAMSSAILALSLENWEVSRMIVFWTMGGLDARTWDHVMIILPITLMCLVYVWRYHHALDVMLLGEIHAMSLGIQVSRLRLELLIIGALLVGAAVSVSGGIGFVGLVVPHIFRLILGPHHKYLLPASALGGALFLVVSDLLLTVFFEDKNIPLGVITAAFGAPFFLFLLYRQRQHAGAI